jgi:hypothetical protein
MTSHDANECRLCRARVLARDGPAFTLAHCWSHAIRKYEEITEHWPVACAEIGALIGELYAIESPRTRMCSVRSTLRSRGPAQSRTRKIS